MADDVAGARDNFAETPTVMSPEPVLDLRGPEGAGHDGGASMLALPAAPAPPPRRQVIVGTALAGVAMLMLTAG